MDVIPRYALAKVRHSERSEESALVRLGPELQILRFAQDDSDFHLHGWAAGPSALGTTDERVSRSLAKVCATGGYGRN